MSSHKPRVDEEEDLDDLDDVLDQFSPPTSQQKSSSPPPPLPVASSSKSPLPPSTSTDDDFGADFSAAFARGMESFLKELQQVSPDPKRGDKDDSDERRKFAAAWEAMLAEDMDSMMDPSSKPSGTASSPAPKANEKDNFQSRIRSTVNKLKESESGLNTSERSAADSLDSLDALLSRIGSAADAPESEEDLQGVLEAMMGQLMSKEVLYEPLKELYEKFPGYLLENSTTISPEDKKRYEAQIVCIKKLLDAFEAKDYDDENVKAREKIAELMGELQGHGSPPEQVMGPLPPGFSMGADGLPTGDCIVS